MGDALSGSVDVAWLAGSGEAAHRADLALRKAPRRGACRGLSAGSGRVASGGAHARPKALNGGHGERLWRRKQPPQAPSAQGKLVIKSLLGANFCTRAGEHGTAAIVPAAFRRRQALSTAWSRPAVAQPCGPGRSGTPAARSPSGWWISPSGIGWSPECRQRMGCQLAGRALAEPWARRRRQQRLQRRRWQRRRQQRRRRRRRRLHLARC